MKHNSAATALRVQANDETGERYGSVGADRSANVHSAVGVANRAANAQQLREQVGADSKIGWEFCMCVSARHRHPER